MRYLPVAILALAIIGGCATSSLINESGVAVTYDEMSNTTTHVFGRFALESNSAFSGVNMFMMSRCKGNSSCSGKQIFILFTSSGNEWQFLKDRRIQMLAGSEEGGFVRYKNDDPPHSGEVNSNQYGPTVEETVFIEMPRQKLEDLLAPSGPVRVRIGQADYQFPPEVEENMSKYMATFQN
jgi:hypothetical protein